ncbi:MAG: T9SS type A sorting domain-containing protein, partial [Muribaculaceae bacterium]|nr:T9SS type A sorting domain-containing protein [Muribaculaceae bacterium]
EGTVEIPYINRNFGDLEPERNNLTSHFALANSIDCEGRVFRTIEGDFTGTIDGRGNEITGLVLEAGNKGAAMFEIIGRYNTSDDDAAAEYAVKNLTLYKPVIRVEAYNALREFAFLANQTRNALIENVHVVEPSFEAPENMRATIGLLVHSAFESRIIGSSVSGAEINFPVSIGAGGIAHTVAGGEVKSTSFTGSITAAQGVGGIAVQNRSTKAVFDDCHVNADLAAAHTVGGIIATSSRSAVSRSLVEGTIAVSQPNTEYTEEDVVLTYNVGGIVGKLESAAYDDPDADGFLAIDKCVVALESLTLSDDAQYAKAVGAHRIVGWTSIDGGSVTEWVYDDDSHESMSPVIRPAAPEAALGENHVISALAEIETSDEPLATEGLTFGETADQDWFAALGYAFDGATAAEPWVFEAERPALFHEATVGTALYFTETEIEGTEGTEINVPLVFRGIDPESIMFSSTDEDGAAISNFVDPGEVVVSLYKPGVYTITATNYFKTATLKVTVKQFVSVDQIGADAASEITFDGSSVKAEGRAISIYNAQGQVVATGNGAVSTAALLPGVYVAKAVAADGSASTLKFAAK